MGMVSKEEFYWPALMLDRRLRSEDEARKIVPEYAERYRKLLDDVENSWMVYEISRKASEILNTDLRRFPKYVETLERNLDEINRILQEETPEGVEKIAMAVTEIAHKAPEALEKYLKITKSLPVSVKKVFAEETYHYAFKLDHSIMIKNYLDSIDGNLGRITKLLKEMQDYDEALMRGAAVSAGVWAKALEVYLDVMEKLVKKLKKDEAGNIYSYVLSEIATALKLLSNFTDENLLKYIEVVGKLENFEAVAHFTKYTQELCRNSSETLDIYLSQVSEYVEEINKLLGKCQYIKAAMKAAAYGALGHYLEIFQSLEKAEARDKISELVLEASGDLNKILENVGKLLRYERGG